MKAEDVRAEFERFDEGEIDFRFKGVTNPAHPLRDICALLMLYSALPDTTYKMITGAEHDIIYFDSDIDGLAERIDAEFLHTLMACGVFYDDNSDCLAMHM